MTGSIALDIASRCALRAVAACFLVASLAMYAAGASAAVTITERVQVNLLRGSTAIETKDSWQQCRDRALELAKADARTSGSVTYSCQTEKRQIVVVYSPNCPAQPGDETRSTQCPAGTTGTFTQTRAFTAAAYPTCWTPGAWTPAAPPAGACPPANRAPTISGTPAGAVQVGQPYSFRPTSSDPDGDSLTFSIANRPAWAQFDAATGRLSGTPTVAHLGVHSSIVITVSDGKASSSTSAFSITVTQPTARLTYAAQLNGTYVALEGAMVAGSINVRLSECVPGGWTFFVDGKQANVEYGCPISLLGDDLLYDTNQLNNGQHIIEVRGASSFSAQFTVANAATVGTANLSWTAPAENEDGSSLTDLAGYLVNYGRSADVLSEAIQLSNPALSAYRVNGLAAGTWFFALRAYKSDGTESASSIVVSKTIR